MSIKLRYNAYVDEYEVYCNGAYIGLYNDRVKAMWVNGQESHINNKEQFESLVISIWQRGYRVCLQHSQY